WNLAEPSRTASSTAVQEVRPGSGAAMTEYGQSGGSSALPLAPRPLASFAVSGCVSVVIGPVAICSEEVQRHVGIVADDPAVVRHRSDVEQVTGVEFGHLAVGERRGGDSGQDQAHVLHLTATEPEGGTDMRRPSPPRLIRRPS